MTRVPYRSVYRLALALALVAALAAPALAQTGEPKEAADLAISGTVKAVDAAKGTITIDGPNDDGGLYDVDPKAEIKNGNETIALSDIKTGWSVSANGDLRGAKKVLTYVSVDDTP
jgi:Cu/Ag efflux protein CusF